MKKKKLNSYLKFVVIIVVSGLIGGILGFSSTYFDLSIANFVNAIVLFIQYQAPVFMWIFVAAAFIFSTFCYRKTDRIIKDFLRSEDDAEQDMLEQKYDFWGTLGVSITNIILCLSIVLFAFPFTILFETEPAFFISTVTAFLLCLIICSVYQIAAVKQMKQKDPAKYDDAMSFDFQKRWLETCDEAEKQFIYQASYKTFLLLSKLMMFALVIALLAHLSYGNGLLAIVLLGLVYIIMMTSYSIYSLKLQKANITEN